MNPPSKLKASIWKTANWSNHRVTCEKVLHNHAQISWQRHWPEKNLTLSVKKNNASVICRVLGEKKCPLCSVVFILIQCLTFGFHTFLQQTIDKKMTQKFQIRKSTNNVLVPLQNLFISSSPTLLSDPFFKFIGWLQESVLTIIVCCVDNDNHSWVQCCKLLECNHLKLGAQLL